MKELYKAAQGLKFSETKGACDLAYYAKENQLYKFPDEKIWKVVKKIEHFGGMGFRAVILQPENICYKTILAFAGTDPKSIGDVITDADQALFGGLLATRQYWLAISTARDAKGKFTDLVLTGHSLGGGLAAYTSLQIKTPATTVNPAPLNLHNTVVGYIGNMHGGANITNYISGAKGFRKGEIVTSLISPGFIIGEKVYVAGVDNAGFMSRHALKNTGAGVDMPKLVK